MATQIYPYPNMTESQGLVGMFTYVNDVSNGILMPLVLLAIFIIILVSSLSASGKASNAYLFSVFITGVLAMPLAILGFLGMNYVYLLGALLAMGVLWSVLDK